MRVLYIGGSGEISHSCVRESVALGHEVKVFNRGRRGEPLPAGARRIVGDMHGGEGYSELRGQRWDVVCQFIAYSMDDVRRDLGVFAGQCGQYVFISTASAYQKPPTRHVITEDVPVVNPYWQYSQTKADMEAALLEAHRAGRLPVTIVRPSHTYRRRFPGTFLSGEHTAWRIRQGKPIVVHGDGSQLWTLTHCDDFARTFVRLLGRRETLGEAYHITDHLRAAHWDAIIRAIGEAMGCEAGIVHVPTDVLVRYNASWRGPLLGDKTWSAQFDNSKARSIAGTIEPRHDLRSGLAAAWEFVRPSLEGYAPDPAADALVDRIIADIARLGA